MIDRDVFHCTRTYRLQTPHLPPPPNFHHHQPPEDIHEPCTLSRTRTRSTDPRFEKYTIGNSGWNSFLTGARWAEGPVWFGDARCLLFSDIPNNRILRWDEETGDVSVYRKPSHNSNGHTRTARVVSQLRARRAGSPAPSSPGTSPCSWTAFDGKRLNAPSTTWWSNPTTASGSPTPATAFCWTTRADGPT
ncbi:MAG: SMP-30/gluconolactonase/LRE family protein [Caldilineaceae bacterium]